MYFSHSYFINDFSLSPWFLLSCDKNTTNISFRHSFFFHLILSFISLIAMVHLLLIVIKMIFWCICQVVQLLRSNVIGHLFGLGSDCDICLLWTSQWHFFLHPRLGRCKCSILFVIYVSILWPDNAIMTFFFFQLFY